MEPRRLLSLVSALPGLESIAHHHAVQQSVAMMRASGLLEPHQALRPQAAASSASPPLDDLFGTLATAPGMVPVGSQATGTLSGKIVYTSPGHGWQWNSSVNVNRWATDRPNLLSMVEDFGNQDQMTYYADYLLRAGATVVPMRPVGRQINEVVLDNDSAGVTFSGTWSNNTAGPRWYDENYGATTDAVKYRFASVNSGSETATATYTPNIPQAGMYPVYTWVASGPNRTNQLYKINHSGGQTQIRVDHRQVGNGWVYLGTYHFNAGSSATDGSVQISNHSTSGGSVVIADAIRFGNGMGDVPWGNGGIGTGSISGYPREDEGSVVWLYRAFGQRNNSETFSNVVGTSNVSAPGNMAEHMNENSNPFGTSVYLGFHSNATTGNPDTATARGAIGLMTTDSSIRTPNQQSWATYTARQINVDMRALNGSFEHNWSTRTSYVGSNTNFGEIRKERFTNSSGVVEMDATIIEVAFHDNTLDAQLMRDPRVRDQIARSSYEATLEYFVNHGGATNTTLPSAPINIRAVSNASGQVTLSWDQGPTSSGGFNGVHGQAPTGYRVYASTNGYGFDGGTFVAGGGSKTVTLSGYDPARPYYFHVVAENAGGRSKPTEVVTALPSGGPKNVLIVNGFDRHDRTQNFKQAYAFGGGTTERVWSRYNNSFDYVTQVHFAIHAAKPGTQVASTSNEAVISGAVNLNDYQSVIWVLGNESTANRTFDATEQSKVEQFIAGGGNLFVTGSEIAWDLDQQNNGRSFFRNTLKGTYVADSAGTYTATAAGGGIFAGLSSVVFSNGSAFSSLDGQLYNVSSADVISPQAGAVVALNYNNGSGAAAIQHEGTGGRGNVVMFGFPFEAMTNTTRRNQVMGRVLDFFEPAQVVQSATPGTPVLLAATDSGVSSSDRITNFNNSSPSKALQFSVPGTVSGATVQILADGVVIGSATASGTTTTVTTNGTMPLADGEREITAQQTEPGKLLSDPSAVPLEITIDATPPAVALRLFNYETSQNVTFQLTEDAGSAVVLADLSLVNVDTNQTISSAQLARSYDAATKTVTLSWPGLNNGILPDGNYRATLAKTNVRDVAGNVMLNDAPLDLWFLQADANRDRVVNVLDFNILAANFALPNRTFSTANFNYDGVVNVLDFNILAAQFAKTLPAAPSSAALAEAAVPEPQVSSPVQGAVVASSSPATTTSSATESEQDDEVSALLD